MNTGSSPLARGLRDKGDPGPASTGIIPARAGFTPAPPNASHTSGDHPRSRGVYTPFKWLSPHFVGSSPLARGLLFGQCVVLLEFRIIPARAGFTDARVRGYGDAPGSSPLARGLRMETVPSALSMGIIPARAGFTLCGRCPPPRAWDHPRSRGVYQRESNVKLGARGSSPLARGLHPDG